ncbi:MAG: hypothetical protein MI867_21165, partial [Pseudomonadales bacterium]|nr:hypothetical protein [Pseudomonadales bacterium]
MLYVDSADLLTDCRYSQTHDCHNSEGTIIWDHPTNEELCPLYLIREVSGRELMKNGFKAFISMDGSMLNLKLREFFHHHFCQARVYKTQYTQLFLAPLSEDKQLLRRTIAQKDISIMTWTAQQDGYLMDSLAKKIEDEFYTLLLSQCRTEAANLRDSIQRRISFTQAADTSLTVALDDGVFATSAAEVWYRYQCHKIKVTALEDSKCYQDLPVRLEPADDYTYRTNAGLSQVQPVKYFLQANTHRLITISEEHPCIPSLPHVFKNREGRHLAITPKIKPIVSPASPFNSTIHYTGFNLSVDEFIYNLQDAGIYDADTKRAFEMYLRAPSRHRAIQTKFFETFPDPDPDQPYGVNEVFHETIPVLDPFPFLEWCWEFFLNIGLVVTVGIGMLTVWRTICFFIGLVARPCGLRQTFQRLNKTPTYCQYISVICFPSTINTCFPSTSTDAADDDEKTPISLQDKYEYLQQRLETLETKVNSSVLIPKAALKIYPELRHLLQREQVPLPAPTPQFDDQKPNSDFFPKKRPAPPPPAAQPPPSASAEPSAPVQPV